jgi:hypothetical protein
VVEPPPLFELLHAASTMAPATAMIPNLIPREVRKTDSPRFSIAMKEP